MKHRIEIPVSFETFSNNNILLVNATRSSGNIFPKHPIVKSFCFPYTKDNGDMEREKIEAHLEANLADAMARVAEIYGVEENQLRHIFIGTLRSLKSDSEWTK